MIKIKDNITISVVIPTCDRPELLKSCVESVLGQRYPPLEIIIIDNGLQRIKRKSLPNSNHIRLVRCFPKFGVAQARNTGGLHAKGDLIAFLDDDDLWDSDYLLSIAEHFKLHGDNIILGNLMSLNTGRSLQGKKLEFKKRDELLNQILIRNPGITGSNTTIDRHFFLATKGYDPYLTTGQDKAIIVDCILSGATVSLLESAKVHFRENTAGPRQTQKKKFLQGKVRFLIKYWTLMNWKYRFFNVVTIIRIIVFMKA